MFMPMVYTPTILSPRVAAVPMAPVMPVLTPRIAAVPMVPLVPTVPVVPIMPPSPRHVMVPPPPPRRRTYLPPANFDVEGVLHNGEFSTLHLCDSGSDFRGVPDYVRDELRMSYGRHPLTDVKVSSSDGRVMIDASPRRYDDLDFVLDYYPPERRMVGFNEVRGEPRNYMRIPRHARYYY